MPSKKLEKKPCDEYTARVFVDLVSDLHKRMDQSDKDRKAGQEERKKIDAEIFNHLKALSRNAGLDDLYKDIKSMMIVWKKYGKPLVWIISFVGGAVLIVINIFKMFVHK